MATKIPRGHLPSSFRDPSGHLFLKKGLLFRQINNIYKRDYKHLIDSGLYKDLVRKKLLVPHREIRSLSKSKGVYRVIKPEFVQFISYPYEWCFSQLKDAALTTLKIQKEALSFEMSLKDASSYNIQFIDGRPILIDTLSFEIYREGQPWTAYRQFCQHFLAPLALMSQRNVALNQLSRIYIDGIPLSLTSSLLPFYTYFKSSLLVHIHLHSRSQEFFGKRPLRVGNRKLSHRALTGLMDSLESAIGVLTWRPVNSLWGDYYSDTNYSPSAFKHKQAIVRKLLKKISPERLWDLGANTGVFSRIAADMGSEVVSFDNDPGAVEKNYLEVKKRKETNLLALFIDLTNPSPALGWENKERRSLLERGPTDCVLALALIHHLAISNNLPFLKIAEFLRELSNSLIIEFVPKSDSQVKLLLLNREDIFSNYSQLNFEETFGKYFAIKSKNRIPGSKRILYLMQKK